MVPLIIAGILLFDIFLAIITEGIRLPGIVEEVLEIGYIIAIFYAFLFFPYCIVRIVKKKNRICAKCDSVEKFTFMY